MIDTAPNCARCPYSYSDRFCNTEDGKSLPSCPTEKQQELLSKSLKEYEKPEILEFARQATVQEAEGYEKIKEGDDRVKPIKPRIVEIIEFAKKMKYSRIGFVFCEGLAKEARVVEKLFTSNGFEIISPVCKAGRTPKEKIGVRDDQKICAGSFEPMCNPIFQAFLLNDQNTQFNILLGLCVGHDSLFFRYSAALCTVLAAKDRLLGHNPLAAIYNIDCYYEYLK
jgi:uncharacterized metal-binding protein